VDELTEITGQSADEAKALIMKAREHWFTDVPPPLKSEHVVMNKGSTTHVQYDRRRVCQRTQEIHRHAA
jgi:hypothetical protein